MRKTNYFVAVLALGLASVAGATSPDKAVFSIAQQSVAKQLSKAGPESAGISTQVSTEPMVETLSESLLRKCAVNSVSLTEEFSSLQTPGLGNPSLTSTFAKSAIRHTKAPRKAPGIVKTGTLISKDLSFQGKSYSYRLKLTAGENEGAYILTGIYGQSTPINVTIDAATGTVSIPCQKLVSTENDDIMVCAMNISSSSITFDPSTPISGTIDDKGVITLGNWGVLITQGANAGKGYNFFVKSEIVPANASVTAQNVLDNDADVTYECLIEQTGDNSVTFYGLSGIAAEAINSRITSAKQILVPNAYVATHMMYGDFYIYPMDVNSLAPQPGKNLVGTYDNGAIDFAGWVIASRAYPTMYFSNKYKNIKVSTDIDISWPENPVLNLDGNGSESSPFVIKTVNDYLTLAMSVMNSNDYEGQYFTLGADLDFTNVASNTFVPLGDTSTPFNGTFDGAGHTIKNLTITNYSFENLGLFGILGEKGTIKNLKVEGCRYSTSGNYTGIVAGQTYGTIDNVAVASSIVSFNGELGAGIAGMLIGGKITNCQFQGAVSGNGSAAGIVGQAGGITIRDDKNEITGHIYAEVSGCQVRANITSTGYFSSSCHDAAGVVGAAQYTEIKNCSSTGTVNDSGGYAAAGGVVARLVTGARLSSSFSTSVMTGVGNATIGGISGQILCYLGGLVGYVHSAEYIRDCYSSSYVYNPSAAASPYVGGLIGYFSVSYVYSNGTSYMDNVPEFTNLYYSGQLLTPSGTSHKNVYGSTYILASWTGEQPYDVAFHNVYYDNQVAMLSGDDMGKPTAYFTSGLPENFSSTIWQTESGKYPVIKSLAAQQASEISAAPLTLATGQTAEKVSKDFTIDPSANVSWGIVNGENIVTNTSALTISGKNVIIKNEYANAVVVASAKDGWSLKYYHLGIVPHWFDGEGTESNPYKLKTAEDFEKLDTAVGTYGQSHTGDYFDVIYDIDFADSPFQGIAAGKGANYSFGGVIDGKGHTIENLNVKGIVLDGSGALSTTDSKSFVGLVSMLYYTGAIKNLTIASNCSFEGLQYVGAFAGASFGRFENCRNYADIKAAGSYSGGITGYLGNTTNTNGELGSTAVISKCYNAGKVSGAYSAHGGIVGQTVKNALVELCQNDADISGTATTGETAKVSHNSVGGIVGFNSQSSVDRCVNNGTINANYSVGGIAGNNTDSSVTGCVDNGLVSSIDSDTRRGAIIGNLVSSTNLANNYFDSSININGAASNSGITGATGLASSKITSGAALDGLNPDDYDFTAEQYPVLKLYKEEAAAKSLRSMVAFFADGQARSNIKKTVNLSKGSTWSLADSTAFSISEFALDIKIPEGLKVESDTLTVVKDGYVKSFAIASIPTILDGEGTVTEPFLIKSTEDWMTLAEFMISTKYEYSGSYFKLVNDLDFNKAEIELIGVNGTKFGGSFDGNNKTISNYTYTNANSTSVATSWKGDHLYRAANIGLFGTLASEGVIKNLTIDGEFTGCTQIGAVAGEVYGRIENVEHKGTIYASSSTTAAGIANKVYDGGVIANCVNSGKVTAKTTNVSGIVSTVNAGALVENCINTGTVNPTTTGAYGVSMTIAGTVRNSGNRGKLIATGTATGVGGTLNNTGKLEGCFNEADILLGATGGTVCGIINNTSDNAKAAAGEPTSWIKNCYNTGNLNGKQNVCGIAYTIKKGVLMEDCYNTGNISAVGSYGAYGIAGALTSNNDQQLQPTIIRRVWNGGKISSKTVASSASSGLFKSSAAGTIIDACYNLGDVTNESVATSNSQITVTCGLFNTISGGHITNCWNAGNINAQTVCNGGIAGYVSGTDVTLIENCFNMGDVNGSNMYSKNGVMTDEKANTNGTAGGLFGYISVGNPVIRNCYNTGKVSGNNRVGGISAGMFRPDAVVENCFNVGKVECENSWWSGTIFSNSEAYTTGESYFKNSKNVYYDADVTPGTQYRDFPGSAKTTAEMVALDLGDAFVKGYGYPYLASFDNEDVDPVSAGAAGISTAMPIFGEDDTADNVNQVILLASSPAVTWTAEGEGELEIIGNEAYPRELGKVTLTASAADGKFSKSYELDVKSFIKRPDSVEGIESAKEIKSLIFVDMEGRIIPAPAQGQPYVVRISYTDGTYEVRKVMK